MQSTFYMNATTTAKLSKHVFMSLGARALQHRQPERRVALHHALLARSLKLVVLPCSSMVGGQSMLPTS